MKAKKIPEFQGFSRKTIAFLKKLERNNNKPWFEAHRSEWEEHVLVPMKALVERLAPAMVAIDPYLDVRPSIDKTISRIHRDTRFARDKSPYRTTLWIAFKHTSKDWKQDPTFAMEFSARGYWYGMGFYQASRRTMDNLRAIIDSKPQRFLEAVRFMEAGGYELGGDKYKRIIDPSKTGVLGDWYQHRSCYVFRDKKLDDAFFSEELAEETARAFNEMKPLYEIFWQARS